MTTSIIPSICSTVSSPSGGGTPTGTVTFYVNGTSESSPSLSSSGGQDQATYSTSFSSQGTITATYNGDSTYAGSNRNTVTETIYSLTSTTTLTSSVNPSYPGQSVTFTATVSGSSGGGNPTGTVNWTKRLRRGERVGFSGSAGYRGPTSRSSGV
jgi:hypothetical protein